MASLDVSIAVRIKPVNKPTDKVIFRVGNAEISKSAHDVVRELLGPVLERNGEAAVSATLNALKKQRPNIGEKGLYGTYAGNARGYNGEPDGILEVLDESPKAMTWDEAKKWAEEAGGRLPSRKEQALLFANVPELFKQESYWSSEPYAGDESYAWSQDFRNGTQSCHPKGNELRARAVRRIPI